MATQTTEVRPDEGCSYMDPISVKYTGARRFQLWSRSGVFVIAVEKAESRTLGFAHHPAWPGMGRKLTDEPARPPAAGSGPD
jgi:hypothetical protein